MTSTDSTAPTDHTGLRVMGTDECLERLASATIGRVGFILDGQVVLLPVHHIVHGMEVFFRTSGDSKIEVAADHGLMGFEVDEYDAATRSGWSVSVTGVASVVDDDELVAQLVADDPNPWVVGDRTRSVWVMIRPDEISGRELRPTS